MPYLLVGNIAAVVAGVLAFNEAGTGGKIALVVLFGATFLAPELVPGPTIPYLMLAARALLAIGCYLFTRWRNSLT
jgi:hypothetical protein